MSYVPTNVSWWDEGDQDFQGLPVFDSTAVVDRPHQQIELAVICIADALAGLLIQEYCDIIVLMTDFQ